MEMFHFRKVIMYLLKIKKKTFGLLFMNIDLSQSRMYLFLRKNIFRDCQHRELFFLAFCLVGKYQNQKLFF